MITNVRIVYVGMLLRREGLQYIIHSQMVKSGRFLFTLTEMLVKGVGKPTSCSPYSIQELYFYGFMIYLSFSYIMEDKVDYP